MFQDIRRNNRLFKGLLIIIRADFAQILLVVYQNIRAIIVEAYIQRFYIWSQFSPHFLQQNMQLFHNENSQKFAT